MFLEPRTQRNMGEMVCTYVTTVQQQNISNMLFMIVHVQLSECTLCAVSSALPHFQDVPWSLLERCRLQCH